MPTSNEPIAKRLIRFRKKRKLSIREVSSLINVPETTYREWEYGRAIRGEPYCKIARAFGVTLEDLLGDSNMKIKESRPEIDFDNIIEALSLLKVKLTKSE